MKLYYFCIKSHCEAPDCEMEFDAENKQDAIDTVYDAIKGTMSKNMIKKYLHEEE